MEAQGAWENGRRKTLIHAPAKPRACENPQTTSWRTLARATKSLGFRVRHEVASKPKPLILFNMFIFELHELVITRISNILYF